MNPFHEALSWCHKKTGLSQRFIFWSLFSLGVMLLFTALFTYPLNKKIKDQDAENASLEAGIQELALYEQLDLKLNKILKETYPELTSIQVEPFSEDRLLELPSEVEELAAAQGVALISFDPRSVDDGAQVAIRATFQGNMDNLYSLLKEVGRVKYAQRLESMTILALPDAEQMEFQFKVPIK